MRAFRDTHGVYEIGLNILLDKYRCATARDSHPLHHTRCMQDQLYFIWIENTIKWTQIKNNHKYLEFKIFI